MSETLYGEDDHRVDAVVRATDRRIRMKALELLDSIDVDDPDARVAPPNGLCTEVSGGRR